MRLVGGVELSADKRSKTPFDPKRLVGPKLVGFAQAEGLIVRPIGDVISICPPLVIKPAEIDELFDKLTKALDKSIRIREVVLESKSGGKSGDYQRER